MKADWILAAALGVGIGSILLSAAAFIFWRKFHMKLVLEPAEIKEAIAEWLKAHHNLTMNGDPSYMVDDPENDTPDEDTGAIDLGSVEVAVISPTKPKP